MIRACVRTLVVLPAASLTVSAAVLTAPVPSLPAPAFAIRPAVVGPAALSLYAAPASANQLTPSLITAASERGTEGASVGAGARFDGTAVTPPVEPVAPPAAPTPPAAPLGSGLRMAQNEHEPWLDSVVGLLTATRTGRRVLRDIDRLAASRGRPVLLDVKPIGNNGEFRYDSDLLVMDSGHLKRDPYQSAPILAHELQHVLQRAMELPVDALELEIESYTVENRVWTELGARPEAGTFARPARNRIMKDLPGFVAWLGGEYKNNIPLYGTTIDAYVARLEKNLEAAISAEKKTLRKRAKVEKVLESMRANGMTEDAIAAHRRDDLEPLDRSLRDAAVNRAWIERDLRMLSTPEGRERFRAYARGVIRRARSLSRS